MHEPLRIVDLLVAISRMPEDRRVDSRDVWYESQREHWIGWLLEYSGPGAYGRKNVGIDDARLVYNRLVCPPMLLYLAKSSGVNPKRVKAAAVASGKAGKPLMSQCKAIRAHVPWSAVHEALRASGYLPRRAM